jgi:hypothetical protein
LTTGRPLTVFALVVATGLSGAGTGCGSADCVETATCASEPSDSSPVDHTATPEGNPSIADDAEAAADDTADAGFVPDATTAADATDAAAAADATDAGDGGAATDAEEAGVGPDASDAGNGADTGTAHCNPSAPDCSNPQCQGGFLCTAVAPSGWFGPIALFDQGGGPPAPTAAACSGTYSDDAFDGNSNPTSPAAACGCTCGSVEGVCSNPVVTIFPDNQCIAANHCGSAGSATCTDTAAAGTGCSMGGQSAEVEALPQATGTGSCGAMAALDGLPMAQWERTGRGCSSARAFATGGCPAPQVCADRPTSSFTPTLCVWQSANTDCSTATGYPQLHKYYSGVVDTRACALGTCGCDAPTGVGCSLAGVTSYSTTNCSDGGSPLADLTVGQCNVIGQNEILGLTTSVSSSGQCTASGAPSSTGSVGPDPSMAVTVCCSQ